MSRALKQRGFTFVGSTICYAFMQATGMVNDHLTTCFRYPATVRRGEASDVGPDCAVTPRDVRYDSSPTASSAAHPRRRARVLLEDQMRALARGLDVLFQVRRS